MNKVTELFGCSTKAKGTKWASIINGQQCPYAGKRCYKTRKSDPSKAIGTCSVLYGGSDEPIVICPTRLTENRQIFADCLHLLTTHEPGYTFDAVVMNPPFSDDIRHVAKAWSLLSPGGRLVAIVGEACFSSSRKKGAYDFCEWLESISATVKRLDGADSFEGTNASARLIFATKESEE